ncbi:MAG TPA: RluA family pseudouridine synthase [Candidatus Azoamicus sp. MARI]
MYINNFLDLSKYIVFENNNFIVFNKPFNLSVHGGSKVEYNLIDYLKYYSPFKGEYLELAHRLDKDTSGCLILAKNKNFLTRFNVLLKSNCVEKEYHALVKGHINNLFNTNLKDDLLNNYNIKIMSKNRFTINYYSIINTFSNFSLIKIFPITGKMHQIRIHLSYLGNPIAGDNKYGSKKFNFCIKNFGLNRMFLHFKSIKFRCPIDNIFYFISTEYDSDLSYFIKKILGEFNAKQL